MSDEKPKLSKAEKIARVDKKIAAKRDELKTFLKENKLSSKEDHSKNKNKDIASGYKALKTAIADLEVKKATYGGSDKKKKGGKVGVTAKYTYPSTVKTSDDKKKYRTHIRALAKKNGVTVEEVLKNVEKYEKAAASAKKAEKPAKKKKADETPVKKKKKAAPVEEEETEEAEETEEEEEEAEEETEEETED